MRLSFEPQITKSLLFKYLAIPLQTYLILVLAFNCCHSSFCFGHGVRYSFLCVLFDLLESVFVWFFQHLQISVCCKRKTQTNNSAICTFQTWSVIWERTTNNTGPANPEDDGSYKSYGSVKVRSWRAPRWLLSNGRDSFSIIFFNEFKYNDKTTGSLNKDVF